MIIILFLSLSIFAAEPDPRMPAPLSVEGVVTSFDEKVITIKQVNGTTVYIPRSSMPKFQGIRMQKDVLKFRVSSTDFVKLNYKSLGLPKPE